MTLLTQSVHSLGREIELATLYGSHGLYRPIQICQVI